MASMNRDDVLIDIKKMLEEAEAPVSRDCCIYRVPFDIRKLNEEAYTPRVVSIGPFHYHSHPWLQRMDTHKIIYCKAFLKRSQAPLDGLIRYIEQVEQNFRSCYSDTIDLSKEELLKMILVDSCFIFELFLTSYCGDSSWDDTYFLKPWWDNKIRTDLLLLENQLPFFVLNHLFNLSLSSGPESSYRVHIPFLQLTIAYFTCYNRSNLTCDIVGIRHFTDLLRTFHLQHPSQSRSGRTGESMILLASAHELREAGVRFEVNTRSESVLDLKFSGRVLEIPHLKLVDSTEILYRNMVALEECHYPHESYICDYVAIMDFLINTSKDVNVLVEKGILVNWLGDSDSVASLFNSLCKDITVLDFSSRYVQICNDLNAFYRDPRHKLKATLRRDYCNTPWKTAASIAGIVLLILSLLQSVCSILQLVRQ